MYFISTLYYRVTSFCGHPVYNHFYTTFFNYIENNSIFKAYKNATRFVKPQLVVIQSDIIDITIAPVRKPFSSGFDPAAMHKDPDIMIKIPLQTPPPIAAAQ